MRVGRNPAKTTAEGNTPVEPPPPVSVGLLIHVPFEAGYHAEQRAVIELAIRSARTMTDVDHHLLVVDNGSSPEVRDWLVAAAADGHIDQLVRNERNLGKVTAVSQILLGAPGPDVVYADGDLRFLPGWLERLLEVRDAFPEAGIIGGAPSPECGDEINGPLPDGVEWERGMLLDAGEVRTFFRDRGFSGDSLDRRVAAVHPEDLRFRRNSVEAYAGAAHCMFLATAAVRAGLAFHCGTEALSGDEDKAFDAALNEAGYLRLSTATAGYRHVGNRLDEEDTRVLAELSGRPAKAPAGMGSPSRFWQRDLVKRQVRRTHEVSFRILTTGSPRRA